MKLRSYCWAESLIIPMKLQATQSFFWWKNQVGMLKCVKYTNNDWSKKIKCEQHRMFCFLTPILQKATFQEERTLNPCYELNVVAKQLPHTHCHRQMQRGSAFRCGIGNSEVKFCKFKLKYTQSNHWQHWNLIRSPLQMKFITYAQVSSSRPRYTTEPVRINNRMMKTCHTGDMR